MSCLGVVIGPRPPSASGCVRKVSTGHGVPRRPVQHTTFRRVSGHSRHTAGYGPSMYVDAGESLAPLPPVEYPAYFWASINQQESDTTVLCAPNKHAVYTQCAAEKCGSRIGNRGTNWLLGDMPGDDGTTQSALVRIGARPHSVNGRRCSLVLGAPLAPCSHALRHLREPAESLNSTGFYLFQLRLLRVSLAHGRPFGHALLSSAYPDDGPTRSEFAGSSGRC